MPDALTPIQPADRVFGWRDHAGLWFSLGVGLLVMQTGAFLVPATGLTDAMIAIVAGSLIGSGLLAWVAAIGCKTGLSSAGLMQQVFGLRFARLPVLLNIVQLLGWTTFELVVMRDGSLSILRHTTGLDLTGSGAEIVATLIWGGILLALLAGSMIRLVRRIISRFGLPLVLLSLGWLSWQFGHQLVVGGADWQSPASGQGMGLLSALDLVIAMPVSWLPLVADYARHGRLENGRGVGKAFSGTLVGYAVANIWCYALGVVVIAGGASHGDMLATLLLAQGGLLALGLVLVDELDNTYGDIYSSSVSAHGLLGRWSIKRWGLSLAGVGIVAAMLLPIHSLEPFLLMLSSVFVPLFGVILGRLGDFGRVARQQMGIDWLAAGSWLGGIALYHLLAAFAPGWGSALPTLVVTFVVGWLTRPAKVADFKPQTT